MFAVPRKTTGVKPHSTLWLQTLFPWTSFTCHISLLPSSFSYHCHLPTSCRCSLRASKLTSSTTTRSSKPCRSFHHAANSYANCTLSCNARTPFDLNRACCALLSSHSIRFFASFFPSFARSLPFFVFVKVLMYTTSNQAARPRVYHPYVLIWIRYFTQWFYPG